MNGRERIEAVLRGERPDRPPVMLHNFMHAAREAGVSMREMRTDPSALARVYIESVERYGLDGVLVDLDTATLAGALGVPVERPEDEPAVARGALLQDPRAVEELGEPEIEHYAALQVWLEGVRLMANYFRGEVYLRGNCDQCPFALAALVRGMEGWLTDLMEPELERKADALLEWCARAGLRFLELMSGTGAHMLSNGDSAAGPSVISPKLYRRFALPWEQRFAARSHELGKAYALHVCGNTRAILSELAACGADAVELDYKTDVRLAHGLMRERCVFIGNLDPSGLVAHGTAAEVEDAARDLIAVFADTGRFILNAGCAIPATAPEENIRAMVRAARSW